MAGKIQIVVDAQDLETAYAPSRAPASPPWWLPILLAMPALIPLVNSIYAARRWGLVATGFIQIDQASYYAEARQFFDRGFHLLYSNPYAGYDAPRIYFQPHFLLLGCFQQLGLRPSITWIIFSFAGSLFAAFVGVYFYREVVGWRTPAQKLGLFCFFWGGGILVLVGLFYAAHVGQFDATTVLHFEPGPARGWWMLNFGRNLVYGPTEAYYHSLVLLCMLFLLRRRFGVAIALAALLSLSHPFTGVEVCLILLAYLVIERLYGDKSVKPVYIAAGVAVFCFHIWYYLFFLNQFAEHRILQHQWELLGLRRSWFYPASTFLPALFIVGVLAAARLWRWPGFQQVIRDRRNRLFLLWFLVIFAFTQHYRIMRPIQPVHFAHGYDWIALFFLGAPLLLTLLDRLLSIQVSWLRVLALSALLLLFLSDNLFWFATFVNPNASQAILLTEEQKEVLDWLGRTAVPPDMVVTADPLLGYLVSTYTRARSWTGNMASTPNFDLRTRETQEAFQDGVILPVWQKMHVFYVHPSQYRGWRPPANAQEVFRDARYDVWECPAIDASKAE
jgi:hypothetical protein